VFVAIKLIIYIMSQRVHALSRMNSLL